jgi:hypothetical protein
MMPGSAFRSVTVTTQGHSGALAEFIKERGISDPEFQRRKQDKECVWCSSKDHFLFACPLPDYETNGLNKSRAQGQQQGRAEYRRELKERVLSRADAQRHFRRTGEVPGAHARANVVERPAAPAAAVDADLGRAIERGHYAPAIGARSLSRSLSRGLSASSASSAGSDAFAFVSDEDEAEVGNGNEGGHKRAWAVSSHRLTGLRIQK